MKSGRCSVLFSNHFPEQIVRQIMVLTCYLLLTGNWANADGGPPRSTNVPRFDVAVQKGLAYLRGAVGQQPPQEGFQILAAYAMIKCGVPKEDPFVAQAIAAAASRSGNAQYQPISGYRHIYLGCGRSPRQGL